MAGDSEHGSSKGVIPYFFYDVISFIIPGASLLIGVFLILFGREWSEAVYAWLASHPQQEGSIAAVSVLAGLAFLLFLGAASAVGFLLSSISYWLVDRVIWGSLLTWHGFGPLFSGFFKLSTSGLMKFGGWNGSNEKLITACKKNFGVELNEKVDIDRASTVCEYYIWSRSQSLGIMASRFDAEKILCQSLALVSSVLMAGCWISRCPFLVIASLFLCMIASLFAFDHHRKKRIYGRFQIFLALCGVDDEEPSAES